MFNHQRKEDEVICLRLTKNGGVGLAFRYLCDSHMLILSVAVQRVYKSQKKSHKKWSTLEYALGSAWVKGMMYRCRVLLVKCGSILMLIKVNPHE